jgi:membrane protein involved in colicin uptake
MTENLVEIIGVGLLLLVVILGIVNMKSPGKGADSMGIVMEEIQKVMEPQVKQIREAKRKKNVEEKQKKNGEDEKPAA